MIGKGKMFATKYKNYDEGAEQWTLFVDGASNENGSGAGTILISPAGHKIHCVIRFRFQASNNKAEYEAFIAGCDWLKNCGSII